MPIGQAYTKWLTQREREALATGCDLLIDHLFDDLPKVMGRKLEVVASTTLAGHLPRRYLPRYTPVLLKQFAVCIITVAWKLAQPKHIPRSSVAEELAAYALLRQAEELIGLEPGAQGPEGRSRLFSIAISRTPIFCCSSM